MTKDKGAKAKATAKTTDKRQKDGKTKKQTRQKDN